HQTLIASCDCHSSPRLSVNSADFREELWGCPTRLSSTNFGTSLSLLRSFASANRRSAPRPDRRRTAAQSLAGDGRTPPPPRGRRRWQGNGGVAPLGRVGRQAPR